MTASSSSLGQVRPAEDVGVNLQSGREIPRHGRAPKARVHQADALAAIEAEIVQGQRQLAAIALAGAAGDEVGEDGGEAKLIGRIVDAAGRHQEIEGRRADVFHALGQQGQSIGEGMLVDFRLHVYLGVNMKPLAARRSGERQAANGGSSKSAPVRHGLVERLRAAESQPAIQADGGIVLGSDFEQAAAKADLIKAMQRLEQQRLTQSLAAPAG